MLAGKLKPPGDGQQRLADWQAAQGQGCDHPVPANKQTLQVNIQTRMDRA